MISEHLFKEAWWRANGKWLGDEAPHGPGEVKSETNEQQEPA